MTPAAIDTTVFEALQANAGADFVVTLVEAFAEEAPRMVADLRACAARGDGEGFVTAAHTLKSNALTFGAHRLATMARGLEWHGPSDAGELAGTLPALHALARR